MQKKMGNGILNSCSTDFFEEKTHGPSVLFTWTM